MVKQNDCKNKGNWLTQSTLSKSFSLFHTTYIEDIKEFFRDYFFVHSLFYIKRFSNVFKYLENIKIKIVSNPKIG